MFLSVPTIRSTSPELCGCPGVLNLGLHPKRVRNSWFSLLVKLLALSLDTAVGIPVIIHNCNSVSHTLLAVRDFKGYAAGHRVALSTRTRQ